jgi:hypothetical protein
MDTQVRAAHEKATDSGIFPERVDRREIAFRQGLRDLAPAIEKQRVGGDHDGFRTGLDGLSKAPSILSGAYVVADGSHDNRDRARCRLGGSRRGIARSQYQINRPSRFDLASRRLQPELGDFLCKFYYR